MIYFVCLVFIAEKLSKQDRILFKKRNCEYSVNLSLRNNKMCRHKYRHIFIVLYEYFDNA